MTNSPQESGVYCNGLFRDRLLHALKDCKLVVNVDHTDFLQHFLIFLGDVFSQSDTAKTMAEISRIDPQFNKDSFLKECEFEIIPAVLEVHVRGCTEINYLL